MIVHSHVHGSVCARLTTHKLLTCNQCVPQRLTTFSATYLHVGLPPMPKVCKDTSRSPTPRFGCVVSSTSKGCDAGKIWCTRLAGLLLQNKTSDSVIALDAAASAAGGHYIAKTGLQERCQTCEESCTKVCSSSTALHCYKSDHKTTILV